MFPLSFGLVSIALGFILVACYFIGIKSKEIKAWIKREKAPESNYRHMIIAPAIFVLGLFAGSLLQPFVTDFSDCKNTLKSNKDCITQAIFKNKK